MHRRILILLTLGLLNTCAYHLVYVKFLHAVFEYAGFRYEATSSIYMVWTYLVAMLPLMAARKSNEPSAVGCALIYALSYVPIQLTLTFMQQQKGGELLLLHAVLAMSMATLFRASGRPQVASENSGEQASLLFRAGRLTMTIHLLSSLGVILMLIEFHAIMKFVSFEEVYDLRSDAAEVQASTLTNYLIMWLTYGLGPFYLARALIRGGKLDWAAGLIIFILVYGATGSKLALLTPLFMLVMRYLDNGRDEFLLRFLAAVVVFVGLVVAVIPEEGVLRWVNSIFLLRVFGSNGWTAAVYYEHFSSNGYTFYNHIGPVNALFDGYPYGDRSLGQEIAKAYFNSDAANFNAGFWASDGFAALGILGVVLVTPAVFIFLRGLNVITRRSPLRLINLWLLGFWMALMNVPFTTSLISCGGLLIFSLIWCARPTDGEMKCA